MPLIGKNGSKKPSSQEEIHARLNYSDPSLRFLNWVNSFGFEKTWLGRFVHYLDEHFHIKRVLALFLFSLLLCLIIFNKIGSEPQYRLGQIATKDIKSPFDLQIIDEVATEAERIKAEKSLPLVFDYDMKAYEPIFMTINNAFREMRTLIGNDPWPRNEMLRQQMIKDFARNQPQFSKLIGAEVPYHVFEWLVENRFAFPLQRMLNDAIVSFANQKIVDLPDSVVRDQNTELIIRELTRGQRGDRYEESIKMSDVKNIRDLSSFNLSFVRGFTRLPKKDQENLTILAHQLLVPNLSLNKQEMAERQAKARDNVIPVQVFVKRNQVIVPSGTPIQANHLTILSEIAARRSLKQPGVMAVIGATLIMLFVIVAFSFLRRYSRNQVKVESKDLMAMATIVTMVVLLSKGMLFVFDTFMDKYSNLIPQGALIYALPIAMGPMLVGMLIPAAEIVFIFAIFNALTLGALLDLSVTFFLVTLVSGIAGARGVFACHNRNEVYIAGLKTAGVAALAIFLVHTVIHLGEPDLFHQLLWSVGAAFCGGVLSSLMALTFVNLLESVFNYTTDMKLLELSSLNHPLMQQLMMKAPGTYHHCMAVGNMCEAAARDIGANPLLAKVMAYYHDIGKMEHAQYFIENQRPGHNPHDHISPNMSKTILIAHVKDGAEMALDYKLGRPIVDGILQHHGTTLISYFYNKALEEQDEDITGHIEESEYRYPGPKPQFREAALVMLGDSIEATARSLEEPTPGRLNSIVENIIESKFMDGQLDECNLTIRDLAIIKETFKRMLQALYHQRMDYPHMRDGKLVPVVPSKKKNPKGHFSA